MISPTQMWQHILHHNSAFAIQFWGSQAVQIIFFDFPCIVYMSLPYLFPKFSTRHKLQKAEKQPTVAEIKDCILIACRNQAFGVALQLAFLGLQGYGGLSPPLRHLSPILPSASRILRDILLGTVIREVMFYYGHRLLHHPKIYGAIHKPHHKFSAPIALAAQYSTIIEHLIVNILPVVVPTYILDCHQVTTWLFVASQIFAAATVHSGYDFFAQSARLHDLHHEKSYLGFGVLGWLDILHGTYR